MKKIFLWMIVSACFLACNNEKKEEAKPAASDAATPATAASDKKPAVELLDTSAADIIKKSMAAFEKLDVAGLTDMYTDDAHFYFSGGDSLIGKQAIQQYYTGRVKLIETIKFSEQIYLPIMANESPNGTTSAGKWLLIWSRTDVKYKNGKALNFWVHTAYHVNDAGKIDHTAQYIDRLPIQQASLSH